MYKVRTTYKDNDLVVESYNSKREAYDAAREECTYSETSYSEVYDSSDKKIIAKYEGWL